MSTNDRSPTHRLIELVVEIQVEGPSEARTAELQDLLRNSDSLRRLYLELMNLQGMLENSSAASLAEASATSSEDTGEMESLLDAMAEIDAAAGQVAPIRFVPAPPQPVRTKPRQPEPASDIKRVIVIPKSLFWSGIAAAILLVGLLFQSFSTPRDSGQKSVVSVEDPASAPADPVNPAVTVARLVNGADAVWGQAPQGDELHADARYVLKSGLVQARFEDGASVVIEGPAEFVTSGANAVRLTAGRLTAQVPASAHGFTVTTPSLLVTDLGTEFGVHVSADGGGEVAVFDGLVELGPADAQADISDPGQRQPILLEAGWKRNFASDGALSLTQAELDTTTHALFARSIDPGALEQLAYRRAVLAHQPLAYWSFDQDAGAVMPSEAGATDHLLQVLGSVDRVDGPLGQALRFHGGVRENSYLNSPRPLHELDGRQAYTISIWCRMAQRHEGSILSLYALDPAKDNAHQFITGFRSTGAASRDISLEIPADAARFTHRDPPGASHALGANVFSERFMPEVWVNLVAVKHPDRIELYRDGELVGSAVEPGKITGSPYLLLGVSPALFDRPDDPHLHLAFNGELDELLIYDHPLSAEQVAELYAMAKPLLLEVIH